MGMSERIKVEIGVGLWVLSRPVEVERAEASSVPRR